MESKKISVRNDFYLDDSVEITQDLHTKVAAFMYHKTCGRVSIYALFSCAGPISDKLGDIQERIVLTENHLGLIQLKETSGEISKLDISERFFNYGNYDLKSNPLIKNLIAERFRLSDRVKLFGKSGFIFGDVTALYHSLCIPFFGAAGKMHYSYRNVFKVKVDRGGASVSGAAVLSMSNDLCGVVIGKSKRSQNGCLYLYCVPFSKLLMEEMSNRDLKFWPSPYKDDYKHEISRAIAIDDIPEDSGIEEDVGIEEDAYAV